MRPNKHNETASNAMYPVIDKSVGNSKNELDKAVYILYRSVKPSDRNVLQELHDEFFPVKYSDKFYDGMSIGQGIHGLPLFSSIAVDEHGAIIGFVFAQFLEYPSRSEDVDLFRLGQSPSKVCYILTLGVQPEYRRYGIASILISKCVEYAQSSPDCGAVSPAPFGNSSV
jgi:histone acetyltransferase MCC1